MSTKTPPGGAQPATPSEQPQAVAVSDACLHGFYYLGQPNGDRFQVVRLNDDGSIAVKAPGGAQVVRLDKRHVLYASSASVEADDAARPPVPRASASLASVDLPDGLRGTPKPNPGGHLDRARIEAALPTMTDPELKVMAATDPRVFVGSLANNELARREAAAAKAPKPPTATAPSKIEWTDAPPRVSATTSASPPRGMTVASAPPSYPSPSPQPKTPRSAPKAAPTPPAAPAAPAAPPSLPNDDRAARARAAWAVLSKNTEALIECAAAYKELEALGLTAPRFM